MARVPRDEVRRLARLARLHLDEEEVGRLAGEMAEILGHFEAIREAEAERAPEGGRAAAPEGEDAAPEGGGAAAADAGAPGREGPSPLREDVPGADALLRPPSEAAPRWADGFFVVPRLPGMDGGEEEEEA